MNAVEDRGGWRTSERRRGQGRVEIIISCGLWAAI